TYDPRDFKTNPVKIQVYPGEPPTSQGRVHLLLHTVERRPNELLTQATRTRYRPYTAGIVAVQNNTQLPNPDAYPAGTLAVTSGAVQSSRKGFMCGQTQQTTGTTSSSENLKHYLLSTAGHQSAQEPDQPHTGHSSSAGSMGSTPTTVETSPSSPKVWHPRRIASS